VIRTDIDWMKVGPLMLMTVLAASANSVAQETAAASGDEGRSPSNRELTPAMEKEIAELQGIATQVVAYRNVNLFIGSESDEIVAGTTIVVDGDRISAIGNSDDDATIVPDGASIIDATNWYAVPGLIDTHVHVATLPARAPAEATLKRYLYGGITTVRDMAGDARALADLSRASLINEIPAPDIKYSALMAGPSFFDDPRTITSGLGVEPGKVPWMMAIDEHTDLSLAVAQARGTWASGIKIYANISGDLVQAIIAEGKRQGMPVWTHAEIYPATIFDTIGATSVSHICTIAESLLRLDGAKPRSPEAVVDLADFDVEDGEVQRYVAELAASETVFDATAMLYAEREREAAEKVEEPDSEESNGGSQRPVCYFDSVVEPLLSALHTAGVPISAGTDVSAPADDPFPALINEIETLANVKALSHADAIRAATSNAAVALGLSDEIGTIESGKYANITFTAENPLQSIGNLRTVVLTLKRGHQFFRSDYDHEPIPELPFPGQ
jgi:imidazolonepropionase-like amidohydrolase